MCRLRGGCERVPAVAGEGGGDGSATCGGQRLRELTLTKNCEHFVSITRKSSEAIRQIFTKKSVTHTVPGQNFGELQLERNGNHYWHDVFLLTLLILSLALRVTNFLIP